MARWRTVRAHTERIKVIDDDGKQIELRIPPGPGYVELPDWATAAIHERIEDSPTGRVLTRGHYYLIHEGQDYGIARHLLPLTPSDTPEHRALVERARAAGPGNSPPPPPPSDVVPSTTDVASAHAEVEATARRTIAARAELEAAKLHEFAALDLFDRANDQLTREAAAAATLTRERLARLLQRAELAEIEARANEPARARLHAQFQQELRKCSWRSSIAALVPRAVEQQKAVLQEIVFPVAQVVEEHAAARARALALAQALGVAAVAEFAATVEPATVAGALFVIQVGLDLARKADAMPDLREWLTAAPRHERSEQRHQAELAIEGGST